jgi:hypothetical protein
MEQTNAASQYLLHLLVRRSAETYHLYFVNVGSRQQDSYGVRLSAPTQTQCLLDMFEQSALSASTTNRQAHSGAHK